jgi:hypothetical protein
MMEQRGCTRLPAQPFPSGSTTVLPPPDQGIIEPQAHADQSAPPSRTSTPLHSFSATISIFVVNQGMSITRQKHQPTKHKAHSSHYHSIHFTDESPAEYFMFSPILYKPEKEFVECSN